MATLPSIKGVSFNYVDGVIAVWLIVGIIVGRKRGMTQEFLPTLKWLGIVILAGLFYQPLGDLLFKAGNGAFNHLYSNIAGYIVIAFAVNVIYLSVKKSLGEKLVGSDYFGRSEYYLGMLCGFIRFACMAIAVIAVMHSRVYSDAELAEDEKFQKKNFEDIRFPTYMSVQHSVLIESFTGPVITGKLHKLMIASITEVPSAPNETIAKKREDQINMIIGAPKK